jgi:hypothetical protein
MGGEHGDRMTDRRNRMIIRPPGGKPRRAPRVADAQTVQDTSLTKEVEAAYRKMLAELGLTEKSFEKMVEKLRASAKGIPRDDLYVEVGAEIMAQIVLEELVGSGDLTAGQEGSLYLDSFPAIGEVKGVIEAFIGEDLVTGEEIPTWARVVNVVLPFLDELVDAGRYTIKAISAVMKLMKNPFRVVSRTFAFSSVIYMSILKGVPVKTVLKSRYEMSAIADVKPAAKGSDLPVGTAVGESRTAQKGRTGGRGRGKKKTRSGGKRSPTKTAAIKKKIADIKKLGKTKGFQNLKKNKVIAGKRKLPRGRPSQYQMKHNGGIPYEVLAKLKNGDDVWLDGVLASDKAKDKVMIIETKWSNPYLKDVQESGHFVFWDDFRKGNNKGKSDQLKRLLQLVIENQQDISHIKLVVANVDVAGFIKSNVEPIADELAISEELLDEILVVTSPIE